MRIIKKYYNVQGELASAASVFITDRRGSFLARVKLLHMQKVIHDHSQQHLTCLMHTLCCCQPQSPTIFCFF